MTEGELLRQCIDMLVASQQRGLGTAESALLAALIASVAMLVGAWIQRRRETSRQKPSEIREEELPEATLEPEQELPEARVELAEELPEENVDRGDHARKDKVVREDRFPSSSERRGTYAQFLAGCKEIKVHAARDSGTEEMREVVLETRRAYHQILVLAETAVAEKAERLWKASIALTAHPETTESWQTEMRAMREAVDASL